MTGSFVLTIQKVKNNDYMIDISISYDENELLSSLNEYSIVKNTTTEEVLHTFLSDEYSIAYILLSNSGLTATDVTIRVKNDVGTIINEVTIEIGANTSYSNVPSLENIAVDVDYTLTVRQSNTNELTYYLGVKI